MFSKYFIVSVILFISLKVQLHAQDQPSDELQRKKSFIAIPTFNYNRSLDFQFGAMAVYFHQISKRDTIAPPSTIGTTGFYTTNDSWYAFLFHRMFIKQDKWRVVWAAGTGDINFQFYTDQIPGGFFIDYTTSSGFVFVSGLKNVTKRLYMGVMASYSRLNTEFYLGELENPDSLKHLVSLGIPITWDSRDYIYNASNGIDSRLVFLVSNKAFGSDLNFTTLSFHINHYTRLNPKGVLASRATVYSGLGEVPFEATRSVGRNDIRGYTQGKFRGEQIASIQTEYRGNLPKRWGYVVFFGLAAAFNTTTMEDWSKLLPGGGAGLRWMALKERKINIGIDVAAGREDWGLYFRIGEAF